MKLPLLSAIVLAVAVSLAGSPSADAKGSTRRRHAKTTTKPKVTLHAVISSISTDTITVKTDKSTKDYGFNKDTEFEVNGLKATASELKEGMRVSVTLGIDPRYAARVSATPAPTSTAPTTKKKTHKKKH